MPTPDESAILDCADAAQWEAWLAQHYMESGGVWMRIAKKGTGRVSVTTSDALDIALCYGWIDGQRKSYNATYFLQRYCPRRARSSWSKINVDRVAALIAAGRMQPAGFLEIEAAKADGRWAVAYESQRTAGIPAELAAALEQNVRAKAAFDLLNKSGQYSVIFPILTATTEAIRAARIQKAITKLEASAQS